jgi:hypothetical protein
VYNKLLSNEKMFIMKNYLQRNLLCFIILFITGSAQTNPKFLNFFDPLNKNGENIMDLNHFSFEGGGGSWWIPPAGRDYAEISDEKPASGTYSLRYSFNDYSIVHNKINVLTESREANGLISLESGKKYEIKFKLFKQDELGFVFPDRIQTNIKALNNTGFFAITWQLEEITERGKWVELTQVFEYLGSNLSPGDLVSRELTLRIRDIYFPESGSGTFYVDDISITEVLSGEVYTLSLDVNPEEIADNASIEGAGDYAQGTQVQISVSTLEGYSFTGWTGREEDVALLADASSRSTSFIMPSREVLFTATFEQATTFQVNLAVDPAGIAADANVQGAGDHEEGTEVQISASAVDGYLFTSWTGSTEDVALLADASSRSTSFIMPSREVSFTAAFEQATTYQVNLEVDPAGIAADANVQGAGDHEEGTQVQISASAVDGYLFTSWTGSTEDVALLADASSQSTSFIMPSREVSFTATYEQATTYQVNLAVDPAGIAADANVQGAGDYAQGTQVLISASAVDGYLFTSWTGSTEDVALLADASSLQTSFTMPDRSTSFTATFSSTTHIAGREMPKMLVYPVPAADIITIEATEMMHHIRIIDMSGKIISNHIVNDHIAKLEIHHLLPGYYIVQAITSSQVHVLPIQIGR